MCIIAPPPGREFCSDEIKPAFYSGNLWIVPPPSCVLFHRSGLASLASPLNRRRPTRFRRISRPGGVFILNWCCRWQLSVDRTTCSYVLRNEQKSCQVFKSSISRIFSYDVSGLRCLDNRVWEGGRGIMHLDDVGAGYRSSAPDCVSLSNY